MTDAAQTTEGASNAPSIDDIIMRLGDLPALPAVAADLVSMMDDDELDLGELAREQDSNAIKALAQAKTATRRQFAVLRHDGQSQFRTSSGNRDWFAHHPLAGTRKRHVRFYA